MPMPSERNGPVAESRVVSVRFATLITECESSVSWIRTARCTEWVRSYLKGPTGDDHSCEWFVPYVTRGDCRNVLVLARLSVVFCRGRHMRQRELVTLVVGAA